MVDLGEGVGSRYVAGTELEVRVPESLGTTGGVPDVETRVRYPASTRGGADKAASTAATSEVVSRARFVDSGALLFERRASASPQYEMRFYGGDCSVLSPVALPAPPPADDAATAGVGDAASERARLPPFFVEFAWLIDEHTRRRVTRQYAAGGVYSGSVFITERRVRE